MGVGRPKAFEHDVVLDRAMHVFWSRGYEATSIQLLVDRMGIQRGSLYDTFGDKRALFFAAITHYDRAVTARLLRSRHGPRSGRWPPGRPSRCRAALASAPRRPGGWL